MNVNLPHATEIRKLSQTSFRSADRDMADLQGALLGDSQIDQLTVRPEGPVEEDALAVAKEGGHVGIDLLDARDIGQGPAALRIGDLVPDSLFAPIRHKFHQVGGRLAGNREGLVPEAAIPAVHTHYRVLARRDDGLPGA